MRRSASSVLLLTNSRDGRNTQVVIDALYRLEIRVIRLDCDRLSAGEQAIVLQYGDSETQMSLPGLAGSEELNDIHSVWFRRPYSLDIQVADPVQKAAAEEEMKDVLDGLWLLLDDRFWVSIPSAVSKARLKPYQLAAAIRVGLPVADTLITNDVAQARCFTSAGPTVVKPLSHYEFEYGDVTYTTLTTLLTPEDLTRLELVQRQPVLLQRYVRKKYEVRVTCVGAKQYPVRLSTPDFKEVVDWRRPEHFERLRYESWLLPNEVAQRIETLRRSLHLEYAAFDLMVDDEERYLFLEVNPIGQWLWLEDELRLDISTELARLLACR